MFGLVICRGRKWGIKLNHFEETKSKTGDGREGEKWEPFIVTFRLKSNSIA